MKVEKPNNQVIEVITANPVVKLFASLFRARETGIAVIVAAVVIYLSIASENFLTAGNIAIVGRQIALQAIIAMGMTMVILMGGIDLSVGSIVALTTVILGNALVTYALPIWVSISLAILVGLFAGFMNGFLITRTKVPPFIITLGMMGLARGAALVITKGNAISGLPKDFLQVGQGYAYGLVPYPIIIAVILAIIVHILLTRTTFGRRIYLVGSNEEAALLSGINVNQVKVVVFALCAGLTAIESVLETARFSTAQPGGGTGYELTAIGSVIIGGASMNGGEGSVLGTMLGAILLGLINNGLILLGVSPYWQQVFSGTIIILAVALDTWRRNQNK